MDGNIYKLWFVTKIKPAYAALSQEERDSLITQCGDPSASSAGKTLLYCNSYWASEQFLSFGVNVYPNMDELIKHTAIQEKNNFWRYMEALTILGMPEPSSDGSAVEISPFTAPQGSIFVAWVVKDTQEAFYALPKAEQEQVFSKVTASYSRSGGKVLLACYSRGFHEQYLWHGLDVFPSLAAVQQHADDLAQMGWYQLIESFSVLGTATQ